MPQCVCHRVNASSWGKRRERREDGRRHEGMKGREKRRGGTWKRRQEEEDGQGRRSGDTDQEEWEEVEGGGGKRGGKIREKERNA